ncbi:MAG TPA: hypothetical protein VE544_12895 [Nitrososphaeraceae archaeon]|jgi:hypothetical protein|nr:hypothetical protein [Nitrososphaeraceae archaeon]
MVIIDFTVSRNNISKGGAPDVSVPQCEIQCKKAPNSSAAAVLTLALQNLLSVK